MSRLAGLDRTLLLEGLQAAGADGWLLFDFRGLNPIAGHMLQLPGMGSRRLFAWVPREGEPVAVAHKIELSSFGGFPGKVLSYARHQELEETLSGLIAGRTVAMEISSDDAVPYLDRVPYGVIELVRRLGATVVSSGPLVTHFAALWSDANRADHRRAAEALAGIARRRLAEAVERAGTGLTECGLRDLVVADIAAAGLEFDHPPIVAFGANAANPHYGPEPGQDATLGPDQVVLLDLWGSPDLGVSVHADQTWMGFSGSVVPEKVTRVWETVRDAREAAIRLVQERVAAGQAVHGYEVDRAAREVIEQAGFGEWFIHRTGHSIDRDLHGSGPHCDDYETHDDRQLVMGVGFSVEPGIYLTGDFGVRSEVNMFWGPDGAVVTPEVRQMELIRARG